MSSKLRQFKDVAVPERVSFMGRTSDIFGSHTKTDLEAVLTLIRRKVQEKCGTTQELITQIRRCKVGETEHVTPNEFRYTLAKFGILIPQTVVDKVFAVFDSDRSGSMDFDEFAMWIMNSEFKPAPKVKRGGLAAHEANEEILRKKLKAVLDADSRLFQASLDTLAYIPFVAELTRNDPSITEQEARKIFNILDPSSTGNIAIVRMKKWVSTGIVETGPPDLGPALVMSLPEAIFRIAGANRPGLERCFKHVPEGKGGKIPFDEFRRYLNEGGLGKNIHEVRALFAALGGGQPAGGSGGSSGGGANVDLLLKTISTTKSSPSLIEEVSAKKVDHDARRARVERHLREYIRKSFRDLKSDFEAADRVGSGSIDANDLHRILIHRCLPLSLQDFRILTRDLKTDEGGARIDWHHFLHQFNPRNAPHLLGNKHEPSSPTSTAATHQPPSAGEFTHALSGHGTTIRPATAGGALTAGARCGGIATMKMQLATERARLAKSLSTIELKGSTVGGSGFGSFRSAATATGGSLKNLVSSASAAAPGHQTTLTTASTVTQVSITDAADSFLLEGNGAERRKWVAVLRDCHHADPDRSGAVARSVFVEALKRAQVDAVMTNRDLDQFVDKFAVGGGGAIVDYLRCCRLRLNEMMNDSSAIAPQLKSTKSASALLGSSQRDSVVHPWDFDYDKEKKSGPYWSQASSLAKPASSRNLVPLAPISTKKPFTALSETDKSRILTQYPAQVLEACARCYKAFLPFWRELRNEFKRSQVNNNRGNILLSNFVAIVNHYGLNLSKNDINIVAHGFRSTGMGDVMRFDEFLRVCFLVKGAAAATASDAAVVGES